MHTTSLFVFPLRLAANTETTKTFIINETNKAMDDSMKKYIFASRTLALTLRSTSRDCKILVELMML